MSAIITSSIHSAAKVITDGGVVICPSEGVYGISCSLFDETAIKRVIAIKERDISKGLIIVDHYLACLKEYLNEELIDENAHSLMQRMWPGPHTFVLPVKASFKSSALRDNHAVAVRITNFIHLAQLCKDSKVPLISTSANISGLPATSDLSSLDERLLDRVDLILDLPCGGQSAPTSIYDTLANKLVRKGPAWKDND